jgi:hypothetical protein
MQDDDKRGAPYREPRIKRPMPVPPPATKMRGVGLLLRRL